jgi:hypothetical protein
MKNRSLNQKTISFTLQLKIPGISNSFDNNITEKEPIGK